MPGGDHDIHRMLSRALKELETKTKEEIINTKEKRERETL